MNRNIENYKYLIPYLRKSTNRDKRQVYSIEHQKKFILDFLKDNPDYKVIWLDWEIKDIPQDWFIIEKKSAKIWWKNKRPWFYKMVEVIKKYGCDYVITAHPNRISRNIEDMGVFNELIEKEYIKVWVITEDKTYKLNNFKDKEDLQDELYFSIKENNIRGITIQKAQRKIREEGIYVNRLPFWYKSKDKVITVVPEEIMLVEFAFKSRVEWMSYTDIGKYFEKKEFKRKYDTIKKMLENPFYIWRFKVEGKYVPIKNEGYKIMISKELFDKVQNYNEKNKNRRWTYKKSNDDNRGYLDKMVFDCDGKNCQSYTNKEWRKYYRRNKKCRYKINMAENLIFKEAIERLKNKSFDKETSLVLKIILKTRLKWLIEDKKNNINIIKWELNEIKKKIDWWIEKIMEWVEQSMEEKITSKIKEFEQKEKELLNEIDLIEESSKDIEKIINKYLEFIKNIWDTFQKVKKEEKANILKWLDFKAYILIDKKLLINFNNKYFNI